jgi:cytochrome c oxidase subunit 1/cytochrome c oxidase subunit I+III
MVSVGSVIFGLGTGLTLLNWVWSARRGAPAGDDPWDGDSLEWATTSPPPEFNFATVPNVASAHPLWDGGVTIVEADTPDVARSYSVAGAVDRTTPITRGLDTSGEAMLPIPNETYLPLLAAFGLLVFFTGLLISAALIGIVGVVLAAVAVVWWAWRTEEDLT